MTNASGVAVIATQVARTDRRALSEAWYSALHLAHTPAGRAVAPARAVAQTTSTNAAARTRASSDERATIAATSERRPHRSHETAAGVHCERRRAACANARRIERAVTTLAARWNGHAAHTIDVAGGRVRLLVRSDRSGTRIVAVCSSPLRETVERALANARFALASSGSPIAVP